MIYWTSCPADHIYIVVEKGRIVNFVRVELAEDIHNVLDCHKDNNCDLKALSMFVTAQVNG